MDQLLHRTEVGDMGGKGCSVVCGSRVKHKAKTQLERFCRCP